MKLRPRQKYGIIKELSIDKKMLCSVAQVSKSRYYEYLKLPDKKKDYEDYLLIKEIFDKGKGKYGWRTIKMKLDTDKGIIMNHKKIKRIKNEYGLFTKIRRVNPYKAVMKKTQEHRTLDNILDRQFKQSIPYQVFCTDITYVPFNHRIAYLSVIKDIGSGEVVAWNLSMHIDMELVLNTVENMKDNIPTLKDILIHSDQGFHYTSPRYIDMIKGLDMIQSMSRKANCIDNAPIESFFGHLKDDIEYKQCKTFEELRFMIEQYIHYYNNNRQQWDLQKMTPVEYRNHFFPVG